MSDLKNQIFALLKKCPTHCYSYEEGGHIGYTSENCSYDLELTTKDESYGVYFTIHSDFKCVSKLIVLTEREYMDIKWKIQDWERETETKLLEQFKEFVESEPNTMDDLLND